LASLSSVALAWNEAERKRNPTPFRELAQFYKRPAPWIANMDAAGEPACHYRPLAMFTAEILAEYNA
jgi:hypothetical protein